MRKDGVCSIGVLFWILGTQYTAPAAGMTLMRGHSRTFRASADRAMSLRLRCDPSCSGHSTGRAVCVAVGIAEGLHSPSGEREKALGDPRRAGLARARWIPFCGFREASWSGSLCGKQVPAMELSTTSPESRSAAAPAYSRSSAQSPGLLPTASGDPACSRTPSAPLVLAPRASPSLLLP